MRAPGRRSRPSPIAVRVVGGLSALLLATAACSSGDGAGTQDHCAVVAAAVEVGAFDDDLLDPAGGPRSLRERLDEVLAAVEDAAGSAPEATDADWRLLLDALRAADETLDAYGYDLVAAATAVEPEATASLVALGGEATTGLRVRLAEDVSERCGLTVEAPTSALGIPSAVDDTADDLDPRVVDPRQLPPERLAGLLARTFTVDELAGAFAAADVDSVSELAEVLTESSAAESQALLDQLVDRVQVSERGDDARLDALWDACVEDGGTACDLLGFLAPPGSAYEATALTCGGRSDGPSGASCSETELR